MKTWFSILFETSGVSGVPSVTIPTSVHLCLFACLFCTPAEQVTLLTEVRLTKSGDDHLQRVLINLYDVVFRNPKRVFEQFWMPTGGGHVWRKAASARKSSSSFLHLGHLLLPLLHVFWHFVFSFFSLSFFHHLLLLLMEQNNHQF